MNNQLTNAIICLALANAAYAHEDEAPAKPDFIPPAPGTYRLHTIMPTPDGEVLDIGGRAWALADFTRGKITLLGLIYTRCADPDGCPRATWAFSDVKRRLKAHAGLLAKVRLVSLSFDPKHDTPETLKAYAASALNGDKNVEWHFLTTASSRQLMPILDGFGQDLRVASESTGEPPGRSAGDPAESAFTHTLKVFLIDSEGRVREIYSTAFLVPQMIVNDIETVLMESKAALVGSRWHNDTHAGKADQQAIPEHGAPEASRDGARKPVGLKNQ